MALSGTLIMEIYLYLSKNSIFHRLHPVTKIFSLMLLFVAALIFNHPLYVMAIGVFVILIGAFSRSLSNLRRIRFLLILLLFDTPPGGTVLEYSSLHGGGEENF